MCKAHGLLDYRSCVIVFFKVTNGYGEFFIKYKI